jgi:hypothetical protein
MLPASSLWRWSSALGSAPVPERRPSMLTPVPWIGLAAIVAMFLLPWLEARGLLDGPRTIRHRPRRTYAPTAARRGAPATSVPAGRRPPWASRWSLCGRRRRPGRRRCASGSSAPTSPPCRPSQGRSGPPPTRLRVGAVVRTGVTSLEGASRHPAQPRSYVFTAWAPARPGLR